MAITRAVYFQVVDAAGQIVPTAYVTATLNQLDVDPVDGFIEPSNISTRVDENAQGVLNLWPNERGSTGSVYRITALDARGRVVFDVNARVPDEEPVYLADIAVPLDCYGNMPGKAISPATGEGVLKLVYVTELGDDDNNAGTSVDDSVRSIRRALEIIATMSGPRAVTVYPGQYYEPGEMEVPEAVAVRSVSGQFVTNIIAQEGREETNMFLVNSGSYIKGFAFRNQRVDDLEDPTTGFAVAFAPGAKIFRSPYIRDISVLGGFNTDQIAAPLDPANGNPLVGNGAGVLLADRAVLDPNTTYPYMLAFGATPRTPNGIGYCAKNGAGINGISSLSIFSRCAFYAINGGQITLNNSGTQFGDFSMRARGTTQVVEPEEPAQPVAASTAGADAIDANAETAINNMWTAMEQANYTVGYTAEQEEFTRRDARNLLKAVAYDMRAGTTNSTHGFVLGLFDYKADHIIPSALHADVIFAWDTLVSELEPLMPDQTAIDSLNALVDMVKATFQNPKKVNFGSLIESLGHQFNNAGAGVNKNALPLNFRRAGRNRIVPFTVIEEDGGRVRWSGSDEFNNQYLAGGTRINGLTGRIEGRPFNSAVRQIARRIANTRGGF